MLSAARQFKDMNGTAGELGHVPKVALWFGQRVNVPGACNWSAAAANARSTLLEDPEKQHSKGASKTRYNQAKPLQSHEGQAALRSWLPICREGFVLPPRAEKYLDLGPCMLSASPLPRARLAVATAATSAAAAAATLPVAGVRVAGHPRCRNAAQVHFCVVCTPYGCSPTTSCAIHLQQQQ